MFPVKYHATLMTTAFLTLASHEHMPTSEYSVSTPLMITLPLTFKHNLRHITAHSANQIWKEKQNSFILLRTNLTFLPSLHSLVSGKNLLNYPAQFVVL